jgi:phenylalanyl-tRNA synthetase beta chain
MQEKPLSTAKRGGTADADEEITMYKIEVPANRYDLLCLEGLVAALNAFRRNVPAPCYSLAPPTDGDGKPCAPLRMVVHPETAQIRPFIVCAVLRGVCLNGPSGQDESAYNSLIELQDRYSP